MPKLTRHFCIYHRLFAAAETRDSRGLRLTWSANMRAVRVRLTRTFHGALNAEDRQCEASFKMPMSVPERSDSIKHLIRDGQVESLA